MSLKLFNLARFHLVITLIAVHLGCSSEEPPASVASEESTNESSIVSDPMPQTGAQDSAAPDSENGTPPDSTEERFQLGDSDLGIKQGSVEYLGEGEYPDAVTIVVFAEAEDFRAPTQKKNPDFSWSRFPPAFYFRGIQIDNDVDADKETWAWTATTTRKQTRTASEASAGDGKDEYVVGLSIDNKHFPVDNVKVKSFADQNAEVTEISGVAIINETDYRFQILIKRDFAD